MKAAAFVIASLFAASALAQGAHGSRQNSDGLLFHYGLVPAALVLAHPDKHPEREMHGGARRGESHVVLALFDGDRRVSEAEVTMHVTLAGGPSVTRRLEPMTIAGQPGFGAFVSVGAPGIYRLRFDVRRPGHAGVASAQFEHRVSPEGRR
jgi:hypothetical protein